MKKRFMGLAVILGLVFTLCVPALAAASIDTITIEIVSNEIYEGSKDIHIANVTLLFDNDSGTPATPTITKNPDISDENLGFYWTYENSTAKITSGLSLTDYYKDSKDNITTNKPDNTDNQTPVGKMAKVKLYATASYTSYNSTAYTLTLGYSDNTSANQTMPLTVKQFATPIEITTASAISVPLGKINYSTEIELGDTNSEITWQIVSGESELSALNLEFDTSSHTLKTKGSPNNTVIWGPNGSGTGKADFKVKATTKKTPTREAEKTFNVTIADGVSASFTTAPEADLDLAKDYDKEDQGIYVGDVIEAKDGNRTSQFSFTAYGTLPLYVYVSGDLPNGMALTVNDVVRDNDTASNIPAYTRGYRNAYITGTPDSADVYTFYICVSNDVRSADASLTGAAEVRKYTMTILEVPEFEDISADVTWSEDFTSPQYEYVNEFPAGDEIEWEIDSSVAKDGDKVFLKEASLDVIGFEFNEETGRISGKWSNPGNSDGLLDFGDSAKYLDRYVRINATKYGRTATTDLQLRFNMPVPKLTVADMTTFSYSFDVTSPDTTTIVTAEGAGKMTFNIDKLSELTGRGLATKDDVDENGNAILKIYGKPDNVLAKTKFHFSVTNNAGTDSKDVDVEIGTTFVEIRNASSDFPNNKTFNIGDVFPDDDDTVDDDSITLKAYPYPVKWEIHSNIDTVNAGGEIIGLSFDEENDNGTAVAHLKMLRATGTYNKAKNNVYSIKTPGSNTYTITAKHVSWDATGTTDTFTITINGTPEITTKNDKAWTITTDKVFKSAALTTNIPVNKESWDIRISYRQAGEKEWVGFDAFEEDYTSHPYTKINNSGAYIVYDENDYEEAIESDDETAIKRHSYLYIDSSGKSPVVAGSLDRIPEGGTLKIRVIAVGPGGLVTSKDFDVNVKGAAPKLGKNNIAKQPILATANVGSWDIPTTGTRPITMKAYIAAKDAQKIFGINKDIDITVSGDPGYQDGGFDEPDSVSPNREDNPTRLIFWHNKYDGVGHLKFMRYGSEDATSTDHTGQAYKGLPVTIQLVNSLNATAQKPTTGTVKIDANPVAAPVWHAISTDLDSVIAMPAKGSITYVTVDSNDLGDDTYYFYVTGDGPITVTPSPVLNTKTKTGLTIVSGDDEYATNGARYYITGAPNKGSETKTAIKFTAKNNSTGGSAAFNATVQAKMRPDVSATLAKPAALEKEVELGKKVSVKFSAKGSKPIKWKLVNGSTSPDLAAYGLALNEEKGTIEGTATAVTHDVNDTKYETKKFYVKAYNPDLEDGTYNVDTDSATVPVTIGIKGAKPKLAVKTLEFYIASKDDANNKYGAMGDAALIKTDLSLANNGSGDLNVKIPSLTLNDKSITALTAVGFTGKVNMVASPGKDKTNYGSLATKKLTANKGVSLTVEGENYGTKFNGSVKAVIYDPKPKITVPTIKQQNPSTKAVVTYPEVKLTLDKGTKATGDSKITWKISSKPSDGNLTAKLAVDKTDKNANTATLTLSLKKVKEGTTITSPVTLKVTATTSSIKDKTQNFDEVEISVPVGTTVTDNAVPEEPEDVAEVPEEFEFEAPEDVLAEAEPEAVVEEQTSTGTITFGEARTADGLTDAQRAAIEEAGYKIIAVLPETAADKSAQYDIDVELPDDAPEGAELAYFAFPVDAETTEDDTIVDFSDKKTGELIYVVPTKAEPEAVEGDAEAEDGKKVIVVSPWLTEGKTYAPVVAVKVENAAGAKADAENLEEGDVVSEEAMQEATEPTAEVEAE